MKFKIPKNLKPLSIAKKLIGVQPMHTSTGKIFTLSVYVEKDHKISVMNEEEMKTTINQLTKL